MKLLSFRNIAILVAALALVANIVIRLGPSDQYVKPADDGGAGLTEEQKIAPSLKNLTYMGAQWQEAINEMPADEKAASQKRLNEEVSFFRSLIFLPEEERKAKMRQHLADLMNDPGVQNVMAQQRMKKLADMDGAKRQKILRDYVRYKAQFK